METYCCPKCARAVRIERIWRSFNPATQEWVINYAMHSTALGSQIQCVCGQLLSIGDKAA